MKPKVFLLMNSIDVKRGGITQACFKQAATFADEGYDTSIFTVDFNPQYPFIRQQLIDSGKLHKNVKIINLHEELSGDTEIISKLPENIKTFHINEIANEHPYSKREGHNAYRIYENGSYTKYVSFRIDNSLDFIDYFNENRYRTKREIYDAEGNLRRIIFMDYTLNKARQSIYYTFDGQAYITIWQNPKNNKITRTLLFGGKDVKKEYVEDNNLNIKVDWINSLITEPSIVISDNRSTDIILAKLNHKKTFKIWRLHSGHFSATDPSKLLDRVRPGYENMKNFDLALFLTEEQKEDVIKDVGEQTKYKVIPHYHNPTKTTLNFSKQIKKDEKLAVVVTRFSSLKRIDHTIKAFKEVVREVPEARLEIWGTGEEKANYLNLITKLNLQNNIAVKGYTTDPDEIYQKGLFSAFTSVREGFGLSCLESLANGCPVISYDIKYGPADMIKNNKNGFLIEANDINTLAKKMIYLFENPKVAKQMGKQACKDMNVSFSYESYKEKWLEVIEEATKKFNRESF
ncbi:glycosyltransferase [Oceanobacillus neutriphilus]|uniref:Poly(Glycerol-phosphate) alpha-glucosyltransferase n=1 Tax=Oceanobacillus neutriphilus TaxID=531815 RepID=A0ABQ2NQJ6_9BACI|nr:glycosyltransferase [Oceanobacillus neutriphilus]GGP07961.1 putative poly(glycerol-phosphate) alpha-glucosyltransferase [Oceanobacillus neutriphilus]